MPRSTGVKDKVDEAAVGLFAARGVDGVSIAEIAATAGHTPAVGLQYLALSTPEMPADQAGGNDERDAPD